LGPPHHRCRHPQPTWFPIQRWPMTCSRRICPACSGCSRTPTCTCTARSRSPCTLRPTLTRVWSRAGSAGQRRVQAPGTNFKQYGFGLVDWRDGTLDFALADGRRAAPLCDQLRRAVARSRSRSRIAMVILDNLGIHTPKGSRLLRALLAELGCDLVLVSTPTYDPDANRIEWLWRALRRTVTHTHRRQTLEELVADADRWARTIPAAQVLSQIGSPFAPNQQPVLREELNHAA